MSRIGFYYNAKFNVAKNSLYQKRSKAMFSLLNKIKKMSWPADVAIELVKPVVLHDTEVWWCKSDDILERLQPRFFKYMLSVNKYTCSSMIYRELGVTPLSIDVKIRMVVYWAKLVSSNQNNFKYNLLYII